MTRKTADAEARGKTEERRDDDWLLAMRWEDLLFMHWPVPAAALGPLIPAGLELDTFEGEAWLGVVPFWMSGIRPRCVPALPWISASAELNVRTYVRGGGRAGVWFFSLDAGSPLLVWGARRFFHLPYFHARMSVRREGDVVRYESVRQHRHAPSAEFRAAYRAVGEVYHAVPGSLDYFLTERLCLFAADRSGEIYRGDIAHERWPLQAAEVGVERNTMGEACGIVLPAVKPICHFVKRLDVVAWGLERIQG